MGEFDLSLIVEFRSRPCLYDRSSPQFKDKLYNAQQWQEISNKLGYDVSILKDRMLQLRNRYNLEKRRMEQLREENPHKYTESPWALYDSLQFLSDHIKARRRYKNMMPLSIERKEELINASANDYSALGTDDAALEAAKDESRGGGHSFPNGLLTVKVEENFSEDQESEGDTNSNNNESEANTFADNSNVMTEIHSITKCRQQRRQQLQQHQASQRQQQLQLQLQQQLQQQQQLQHNLHQQLRLRQNQQQHYNQQNHSTPLTAEMSRRSVGNDVENQMSQSQSTARKRPFNMLSSNDEDAQDYNFNKKQRLSPRELKYNAFGNFVSSSLLDLPQKMALELVEKFTSDIVKALTMKVDSMEEKTGRLQAEQ